MDAWKLDSLWMRLLGLAAAAALGGAVLDIGAASAQGFVQAAASEPSADARADARYTRTGAPACAM